MSANRLQGIGAVRHRPYSRFRETRALYRSFCAQDNASTADRLTAAATLAADRFFLRRRAIDRCVLRDHGGFPRLELLKAVLAGLASDRPKHFPSFATAFLEFSAEPQPTTGASLRANRTRRRQTKRIYAGVRK
jgi:hypothetical protein